MSSRFGNFDRYREDDQERNRADDRERHRQRANRQSSYDFDRGSDSDSYDRSNANFPGDRGRGYSSREPESNRSYVRGNAPGYDYDNNLGTYGRSYGLGRSGYDERVDDYNLGRRGRQDYERSSEVSQYGANYRPNFEAGDDAFGSYESFLRAQPGARPSGRQGSNPSARSRSQSQDSRNERGWWERVSDELASWFGDENAERRRRMDESGGTHRGKGPRGYKRSDQRILDDINERLTEYEYLDASDITVVVNQCVVTLTGTVDSRWAKRSAEGIVDTVSGVEDIQNNLHVARTSAKSDNQSIAAPTPADATIASKAQAKTAGD